MAFPNGSELFLLSFCRAENPVEQHGVKAGRCGEQYVALVSAVAPIYFVVSVIKKDVGLVRRRGAVHLAVAPRGYDVGYVRRAASVDFSVAVRKQDVAGVRTVAAIEHFVGEAYQHVGYVRGIALVQLSVFETADDVGGVRRIAPINLLRESRRYAQEAEDGQEKAFHRACELYGRYVFAKIRFILLRTKRKAVFSLRRVAGKFCQAVD